MRIAFRADASPTQGTGHVMRCLTLAAAAIEAGHDAGLFVNDTGVAWLEEYISSSAVEVTRVEKDSLTAEQFVEWNADRLVVDSYEYADSAIDDVQAAVPTLVLVDFGTRAAQVSWYLDSNLGAEARSPESSVWLAGSEYSLVRPAIRAQRDAHGADIDESHPHIVVFLGGSDPLGLTAHVIRAALDSAPDGRVSAVGNSDVQAEFAEDERVSVSNPGSALPELLGSADIIVCAAGTSAWDVCTIGKPAVFLGLVDNQVPSIGEIQAADLGPAFDTTGMSTDLLGVDVASGVREILGNADLRSTRAATMANMFDGRGASRVIEALAAGS